MKPRVRILAFCLLAIAYAYYIWQTRDELPDRVATHFNVQGAVNDWMSRDDIIWFMLFFGVGIPLVMFAVFSCAHLLPTRFINLPNRERWLSPERQAETVAWLSRAGFWLASTMILFMGVLHHFVIQANTMQPPRLDSRSVLIAAGVLFAVELVFVVRLLLRFSKRSTV
jgi:hypothetical protein